VDTGTTRAWTFTRHGPRAWTKRQSTLSPQVRPCLWWGLHLLEANGKSTDNTDFHKAECTLFQNDPLSPPSSLSCSVKNFLPLYEIMVTKDGHDFYTTSLRKLISPFKSYCYMKSNSKTFCFWPPSPLTRLADKEVYEYYKIKGKKTPPDEQLKWAGFDSSFLVYLEVQLDTVSLKLIKSVSWLCD
jgi:hypothetical protein